MRLAVIKSICGLLEMRAHHISHVSLVNSDLTGQESSRAPQEQVLLHGPPRSWPPGWGVRGYLGFFPLAQSLACCPLFVGLTGCCSLCVLGFIRSSRSLVLQHHLLLLLQRRSLCCLFAFLLKSNHSAYVSKSGSTNHKLDDSLLVIYFTKVFTTVHF